MGTLCGVIDHAILPSFYQFIFPPAEEVCLNGSVDVSKAVVAPEYQRLPASL
jgi:hypothetical protein